MREASVHRSMMTLALGLAVSLEASPQQPAPVFRSGVDLLTVQAAVMDKDGRPVRDLQTSDFTVTVNGQPRKVVFARFNGADATGVYAPSAPGAAPTTPVPTPSGRLVMFVVDRDTIRTGSEKALFEAGSRVLDALAPSDAVGLLGLPTGGVKLTREHQRVRAGSERDDWHDAARSPWRWQITWPEAEGIERGDKQMLAQAVDRECRPPRKPPPECPDCPPARAGGMPGQTARAGEGDADECPVAGASHSRERRRSHGSSQTAAWAEAHRADVGRHAIRSGASRRVQSVRAQGGATAGVVLHTIHVDQPTTDVTTSSGARLRPRSVAATCPQD